MALETGEYEIRPYLRPCNCHRTMPCAILEANLERLSQNFFLNVQVFRFRVFTFVQTLL